MFVYLILLFGLPDHSSKAPYE